MPALQKTGRNFFFEKNEVNFSPFWLHRYRTKCSTQNLITLLETPDNFTYLWWFSKKNINFKSAKIGIVQKIRENDFVQNLVTFFSLALRSNEDCGQTIHRTHLKRVSKESSRNFLAASIKNFENPSIFDRFIVKKLSLR